MCGEMMVDGGEVEAVASKSGICPFRQSRTSIITSHSSLPLSPSLSCLQVRVDVVPGMFAGPHDRDTAPHRASLFVRALVGLPHLAVSICLLSLCHSWREPLVLIQLAWSRSLRVLTRSGAPSLNASLSSHEETSLIHLLLSYFLPRASAA